MPKKSITQFKQELEQAHLEIQRLTKTAVELNILKEHLVVSEERYRAAFEYTGTAMLVIDEDTTILMANHKLEEITGYAHEESLKRRKWTEVVVPEDIDRMMEYHLKRRQNPSSVPNEYEFKLIDRFGNKRDLLLNVTLIPGTAKSLVSLVDIFSLKQSERALRESEKQYRDLFENATDIIYTIDFEGNFTSANISALTTYGYTREEMLTTNIRQLIDPEYLPLAMEKISDKRSLSTPTRYELLTRTKQGIPVWVEVNTRLIREAGRSVGIQGIARDITERKRYEEQLHDSIVRFKETADLLPGIICEIDNALNLTYANELGLTFFGFSQEDFCRGISVLQIVPGHERERFMQDVRNVSNGDYGNPKLYEMLRKDGQRLQLIINSAPILKNGTITGIRSCLLDISDRVRTEKQLRESEDRFRSIYTFSPIGIALYSTTGTLFDANSSFTRMFADAESNPVFTPLFTIIPPGHNHPLQLKPGEQMLMEIELPGAHPGGNPKKRWYEWHITSITQTEDHQTIFLAQVQDVTLRKLTDEARLQKERNATARAEAMVAGLQRELHEQNNPRIIISHSPQMKQILDSIPDIACASATVLVMGDSGTGKELVARSLHEQSTRKDYPFIAINCSALPDNLLESELFGYRAGAFTDAKKDKAGRFELAEGGTLFLDEIGDISPAMQVKLLRALQERIYEPLGATAPVAADIRIIAATNKNLMQMVQNGTFREDFFYRINIVTIQLPPLRERRSDIPFLCSHFIERFNVRYKKTIVGLNDEAMQILLGYDFPGNIRELENIIEHAFIFCKETHIGQNHLPTAVIRSSKETPLSNVIFSQIQSFEELERLYLASVLKACNNDRNIAAERLGVHKTTLFRKLKQLDL